MNENEKLKLAGYVVSSKYRVNVMSTLSNHKVCIPTKIAKESGILTNHISKVLSEKKDKNLVICLNEDTRKGRLYRLTPLGVEVQVVVEGLLD